MIQINISIQGTGRLTDVMWALKSLVHSLLTTGLSPQILKFGYKNLYVSLRMTELSELPKTGEELKQ